MSSKTSSEMATGRLSISSVFLLVVFVVSSVSSTVCNASYELTDSLDNVFKVGEILDDGDRLFCSVQCFYRSWCEKFAFCGPSTTAGTCYLLRDDISGTGFMSTSGCLLYTETERFRDVTNISDSKAITPAPTSDVSTFPGTSVYTDCSSYTYYSQGHYRSGYNKVAIQPDEDLSPFSVWCNDDQILIQYRDKNCETGFFNRSWAEYEAGFENEGYGLNCFWLGNQKISAITQQSTYQLEVKLKDYTEWSTTATYSDFKLDPAGNEYCLDYNSFSGSSNGIDVFALDDVKGAKFHVYDRATDSGCSAADGGGWWYNSGCSVANLNHINGPLWYDSQRNHRLYKASSMSLRREISDD